jgi:biotin operon repressor
MGQARNWTKGELDRLAEEWGQYSIPTLAKRLNRSEDAIKIRAQRMGLGAHIAASELISLNVLMQELGLSRGGSNYTWSFQKLKEAGLKIHTQRVQNNSFRMVDIEEFWEFAEKNRHLFDFSRLEENALGAEPSWVKVKRAEDYRRTFLVKPHNHKWTDAEDKELLRLLRAYRYTYPEIAAKLRRSEGAIQRRVNDLGIKERPIKVDNHVQWTEEQFKQLGRMMKAGSNYETMSAVLGKSAKAIRGKVFTVYLTERLDKACALMGDGEFGDNRPERKLSQKLLMTVEEKAEVKESMSKLVGLLTYQIRKHFDDQDNWQRNLCQNWDEVKGCTVGGTNCDDCGKFQRIRPQYCDRCGGTFFERKENRICERCRTARKKSAARKYMWMQQRKTR